MTPASQIKEGLQTMEIIQSPRVCWTTPFAEMILDWIRKVLEQALIKLNSCKLQIR